MSKNKNRSTVTFSNESKTTSPEVEKLSAMVDNGQVNMEALDEVTPVTVSVEEVPQMVINPEVVITPKPITVPDPIIDTYNIKIVPKFFQVGSIVRIKENTTKTATGANLPDFALKNTYRVTKNLDDRVIIRAGFYQTAVTVNDLVFAD